MKSAKREVFLIYLNDEEKEIIKLLVKRVSPGKKNKPIGQIIRKGIVALAENPDLDYLFDPGVCLKLSPQEIQVRQKLYMNLRENIEVLKQHGLEFPGEEMKDIENT